MWLSLTNSVLFLVFFGIGCWFSYSNGYTRGLNENLMFRVVRMENPDMFDPDEDEQ